MTVTTESVIQTDVVLPAYPYGYKPVQTRDAAFWKGSEEDRTFFTTLAYTKEQRMLVVKTSDPRSEGMRVPSEDEATQVGAMGLDPKEHRVWTIDQTFLVPVSEPENYSLSGDYLPPAVSTFDVDSVRIYPTIRPQTSDNLVLAVATSGSGMDLFGWEINERTHDDGRIPRSLFGKRGLWIDNPVQAKVGQWISWGHRSTWYRVREVLNPNGVRADLAWTAGSPEVVTSGYVRDLRSIDGLIVLDEDSEELPSDLRKILNPEPTEINRLRTELAEALGAVAEAKARHEADIEQISETLIEEANRREWCGEYDEIVDRLNDHLHIQLQDREQEVTVVMDVVVRVTRTIMAKSEDIAAELFQNDVNYIDDLRYDDPEIRSHEIIETETD